MKEDAEELKELLEDHERRISRLETVLTQPTERGKKDSGKKKLSVKEFMLQKNPRKDVLKTLTIGYYLEKYGGMSCFTIKDIQCGFRSAKEPAPDKISDKIYQNAKKGHLMGMGEKKDGNKAWQLTSSGERFVENGFKSE